MKKYETWLPVFPGFYGTIFEPTEEAETDYINEQRDAAGLERLKSWDIDWDYEHYQNDMAEQCCSFIEGELITLGMVSDIRMQELRSPREYNFANDSINIEVSMDMKNRKAIQEYIYAHRKDFQKYLKNTYTSCSGFISSYSNLFVEWDEETGGFYKFDNPVHYLGAVLHFICQNEDITDESMHYSLEGFIQAVDIDFEIAKIKCPKCGEYYVPEVSQKDEYKAQVEKEKKMYMDVCGGKQPAVKSFEQWVLLQPAYVHCEG